jgi:serine/threonine protein kinase
MLTSLNACRHVIPYVGCGKGEVDPQHFPVPVFYLVTKFIEGSSLEEFSLHRTLVPGQCLEIGIQLLRAVEYATTRIQRNGEPIEIIHRDLDFDSIAVRESPFSEGSPSFLQVFVFDYGIARIQERASQGLSKSPWLMTRPTLPWETWFPGTNSHRFGVFTDTYSVGMILLDLLFSIRDDAGVTRGMPAPSYRLSSLRAEGQLGLDLSNDERRENFKKFLGMYLPHIHLGEDSAEGDPTSPTRQLRRVLERGLAFGCRNEKGELIFGKNERYQTAKEMLDELNAIRLELFYRQAQRLLEKKEYLRYEALKQRLWFAMEWDSDEDEVAWNLLGDKLRQLEDGEAAEAFNKAIRIANRNNRLYPEVYRNSATLCQALAAETGSVRKAELYRARASEALRHASGAAESSGSSEFE